MAAEPAASPASCSRSSDMAAVCVVQARMGSRRLPGKVVADLAGRPMLRFMLERLDGLGMPVVVATSDLDRDDPVAEVATTAGASVVRGPEDDVLARFRLALEQHPVDHVVRLTADCPLSDPKIVQAVLELHEARHADYTCNVLPRTFPKGLDVEVARVDSLRIADREATDAREREHVMPFLYRRPSRFRLADLRGLDVGMARIDVDEGVGTVSIAIAPPHRGRGLAHAMLQALLEELRQDMQVMSLEARVHPENVPSLKAFEAAGFRATGEREGLLVLARMC